MADEVITAQAPVEAAPVAAPVVDVAPVSETSAPVVDEAHVIADAPAPLLAKVEETAPTENKDGADKPVDEVAKVEVEPVPLPTYEFKLPEGAQADNPQFKAFQTKLGEFQNLSKAEQISVQKFGQEMLDMHMEDVKSIVENANKASWDWFNNRNKEWLESAKKDPSIGGDNWDSTLNSAQSAISLYGGNKAQQLEVAKMFQETGVENHPALLRFLSNITRTAAKEGSPVAGSSAPTQQKQGIAQALYGNSPRSA